MSEAKIPRYGRLWTDDKDGELAAERHAIRSGGKWMDTNGRAQGNGLLYHYLKFREIVWPKRYRHEWTDLIYSEIIKNSGTILMGSASSGKTTTASEWVLIDYWCHPDNTCVLVSTTTVDKLESAVFGEIKMLWNMGRKAFAWLPGNLIDSKKWIVTDDIDEKDYDDDRRVARDIRKGILGKACYQGSRYVGLGTFAGIKQERFRFLCDELQYMQPTFMDVLPNMRSNTGQGGLKVIGSGNPNHDPTAQLTIVAEPKDGWGSVEEIEVTTVWETNFHGFRCVNLIGIDGPNFKARAKDPTLTKDPYYRMIGPEFAAIIEHDYGKGSKEYETQVMGRMRLSLAHSRVITREMCRAHRAHDQAVWKGTPLTKIHATDPAYGEGDRCIQGHGEFGEDNNGNTIIKIYPPQIIKINIRVGVPEDQIAHANKAYCDAYGIPYSNSFYDSFGKGTIGFAYSRIFGYTPPNPVDAGGPPSDRPVRDDLYVWDNGKRRHKTCKEHYFNKITEEWFSTRYAIEADQVRELPHDVMMEGCSREYEDVAGAKIQVMPKDKMRKNLGRSPDLYDWFAVLIEGARQRGFKIARLSEQAEGKGDVWRDWFAERRKKQEKLNERATLAA